MCIILLLLLLVSISEGATEPSDCLYSRCLKEENYDNIEGVF